MTSRRTPLISTICPTIGCPPNDDCHSSCERMAIAGGWGGGAPGAGAGPAASVSPSAKSRPSAGLAPSTRRSSSETEADRTRSGRSPAVRFTSPVLKAPTSENDWFSSWNSKNSGGDTQN